MHAAVTTARSDVRYGTDGSDEIYKKKKVENKPHCINFSMSNTNMHAISSKHLVSSI
jgi:hypothetical protein